MHRPLLALLALLAAPSHAQIIANDDFNRDTDARVAVPALSLHTPAAESRSRWRYSEGVWRNVKSVDLVAVTDLGLSVRSFASDRRAWNDWTHLGNPENLPARYVGSVAQRTGWDDALTLLSNGQQRRAVIGMRRAQDDLTALPGVDPVAGSLDWLTYAPQTTTVIGSSGLNVPHRFFSARTGFVDEGGLHFVFGNGVPGTEPTSRTWLFNDTPLWSLAITRDGVPLFSDHGLPADYAHAFPGAQSTASYYPRYRREDARGDVTYDRRKHHFVAVTVGNERDGQRLIGDAVYLLERHDDRNWSAWQWASLGAPAQRIIVGGPLVVSWYDDIPAFGGLGHVSVLVVARDLFANDYRVFERSKVGDGAWSGWADRGRPGDLPAGTPFQLTNATLWNNGAGHANQHVTAFGYSEPVDEQPGKLVTFWRAVNGQWSFGASAAAPDGESLRTTDSAAIDQSSYDRISAFVRTAGGRIYEYFYTIEDGRHLGWQWRDLSFEPRFRVRRF